MCPVLKISITRFLLGVKSNRIISRPIKTAQKNVSQLKYLCNSIMYIYKNWATMNFWENIRLVNDYCGLQWITTNLRPKIIYPNYIEKSRISKLIEKKLIQYFKFEFQINLKEVDFNCIKPDNYFSINNLTFINYFDLAKV